MGFGRFLGSGEIGPEALAEQVDYLVNLAGPGHVGIGLDYAFPVDAPHTDEIIRANASFWPPARGYAESDLRFVVPDQLLELTEILLRRGHSEKVVRDVLGENFLRLAGEVWK